MRTHFGYKLNAVPLLKIIKSTVVIVVFDRVHTITSLLDKLAGYKFDCLIIASDGPRSDSDNQKIDAVRKVIEKKSPSANDLIKLYRDENLGMFENALNAIDLAMTKGEETLILEDDVLPEDGFFDFLEAAIDFGRGDPEIAAYCGFNPIGRTPFFAGPFHKSKGARFWGVCLKKNHWMKFRDEMDLNEWTILESIRLAIQRPGLISKLIGAKILINHRKESMMDLRFGAFMYRNRYLSLVSSRSLICNVGSGESATHTREIPDTVLPSWLDVDIRKNEIPDGPLRRNEVIYGYLVALWWLNRRAKKIGAGLLSLLK